MSETFYDVLGVPPDASQAEIRRAYREAVKECHPDVSDHPDAAERFRVVSRAEEVLGDEAERERYDRLGHDGYVRVVDEGVPEEVVERARADRSSRERGTDSSSGERASDDAGGRAGAADDGGIGDTAETGGTWATGPNAGSDNPSRRGYSPWSDDDGDDDWWEDEFDTDLFEAAAAGAGGGAAAGAASTDAAPSGSVPGTGGSRTRTDRRTGRSVGAADRGSTTATPDGSAGGFWSADVDPSYDPDPTPGLLSRTYASREARMYTVALLFIYPIFVYFSATEALPATANVVIAGATVVIVVAMLTEPGIALVVFGVWTGLSPLVLTFVGMSLLTTTSLAVMGAFWAPFALTLLVALAVPT